MAPLLLSFLAAMLAEWGDKTQLLVAALATHFRRPAPIIAGVAVGASLNLAVAAVGGAILHDLLLPRALLLLLSLALLVAGAGMLVRPETPSRLSLLDRAGAFVSTAAGFFLSELGDKTQFTITALTAYHDAAILVFCGALAGILIVSSLTIVAGNRLTLPVRAVRIGSAVLFLGAGVVSGLNALRLF